MKVGDYVRTNDGCICKVLEYTDISDNDFYVNTDSPYNVIYKSWIVKSSPNIIDLIQKGDFVKIEFFSNRYLKRLERIFEVDYVINKSICFENGHCQLNILDGKWSNQDEELKPIIKSIVTKEQFESMEYKIGEQKC